MRASSGGSKKVKRSSGRTAAEQSVGRVYRSLPRKPAKQPTPSWLKPAPNDYGSSKKTKLSRTRGEVSTRYGLSQIDKNRKSWIASYRAADANEAINNSQSATKRDFKLMDKYLTSPKIVEASQRAAEKLIRDMQKQTGNKGVVNTIRMYDRDIQDDPAGYYISPGGGQISLGTRHSAIGSPKRAPKLTAEQKAKLTPAGRKFYKRVEIGRAHV